MLEIGEQLKKLRVQKQLTQKEVADYLNITPQTISKWELNRSYPDLDHLVKLSRFFNVDINLILGIKKESFIKGWLTKEKTRKRGSKIMKSDKVDTIHGNEKIVIINKKHDLDEFTAYPKLRSLASRWTSTNTQNNYLRFNSELTDVELCTKISQIVHVPIEDVRIYEAPFLWI
ncbi:helix-turn-helix domain-containing protein [Enterococcus sp. JM9B]|uniref:helix-turn-helix domain-containing protein n=1 Tax=Enterococcus sp. JM9B TaxID=1857216 RepID=UPI00137523C3|nr:helix-turn-helix domain-containing protein [Enterococcus sp. JM9B]KAF1303965.1 hypothetical protein BAU16_03030 [Enterococcus sp. JM9B]